MKPAAASVFHRFDALFVRHGRVVPPAFLRALAFCESSNNPASKTGSHTGLLQPGADALSHYNARHGTAFMLADLLDPETNVLVAEELLAQIQRLYAHIPGLTPDFGSRRWIELYVLGWNAGFGGVAAVVESLVKAGRDAFALTAADTQQEAARRILANDPLKRSNGRAIDLTYVARLSRLNYARKVTELYLSTNDLRPASGNGALVAAAIGAAAVTSAALAHAASNQDPDEGTS